MEVKIDAIVTCSPPKQKQHCPVTPKAQRAEGAHSHAGALS
jgi:hypothetical protein